MIGRSPIGAGSPRMLDFRAPACIRDARFKVSWVNEMRAQSLHGVTFCAECASVVRPTIRKHRLNGLLSANWFMRPFIDGQKAKAQPGWHAWHAFADRVQAMRTDDKHGEGM